MVIVPTFTDPFYEESTRLDGVEYILRFKYNQREDCWYLTIATPKDVDIVKGVKLVCDWSLLLPYKYNLGLPQQSLFVFSNTTDKSPPGLLDLDPVSGRCQLVYSGD